MTTFKKDPKIQKPPFVFYSNWGGLYCKKHHVVAKVIDTLYGEETTLYVYREWFKHKQRWSYSVEYEKLFLWNFDEDHYRLDPRVSNKD